MSAPLPMFPLSSVVFPGMTVPLHVFEDRYRALVHHLLTEPDPTQRVFGTVAIREGYEVGDHGGQSLYRVGTLMQLTEVEENPDGTFDVVAVARERLRLSEMVPGAEHPQGLTTPWPDDPEPVPDEIAIRARAVFTAYRAAVADLRGDPFEGHLPRDGEYLSWTLSALAPLPMAERQLLLEAAGPLSRLQLVTTYLRDELRAINVIPSLPATEVARTRWSPN
ncbi:MAG: LON peptidase substrate-binding domain-containing protein [Nocardioides sp.]|uniref:LON peptidase substrate-binding domain-containing protein n=1 Tax=Nocardioides sp. TaxID=35761 RepID=UPI003EFFCE21